MTCSSVTHCCTSAVYATLSNWPAFSASTAAVYFDCRASNSALSGYASRNRFSKTARRFSAYIPPSSCNSEIRLSTCCSMALTCRALVSTAADVVGGIARESSGRSCKASASLAIFSISGGVRSGRPARNSRLSSSPASTPTRLPSNIKGEATILTMRLAMALPTMPPKLNCGSLISPDTGKSRSMLPSTSFNRATARSSGSDVASGCGTLSPRANSLMTILFLPCSWPP